MDKVQKRIVFYDTPRNHIDLKIRLKYDDIKFSDFFRFIIKAYLSRDERIVSLVEEQKDLIGKQSKTKRQESERLHRKASEEKSRYGLNEEEIESIFDLIERENPEL